MSDLVTDPDDPRLGHGVDTERTTQNEAYLILSAEERAKGFVRPLRRSYRHVGLAVPTNLRDLTEAEHERYDQYGYVKYAPGEPQPCTDPECPEEFHEYGRYYTEAMLKPGCGSVTTMSLPLCETYARDPKFYGATFCVSCAKHLPVAEFVWVEDGQRVGE